METYDINGKQIKVGMKVKRIKDVYTGWDHDRDRWGRVGEIYTVIEAQGNSIRLEELSGEFSRSSADSFEIVEGVDKKNTKTIDEKLAVMRAWLEGEKIESCSHFGDGEWYGATTHPWWDWDEFDYRVKPSEPVDDYINWDHVSGMFNFMARDNNGDVFLYKNKPELLDFVWTEHGGFINVEMFSSFKVGNKPWNESLVKRP